MGVGMKFKHTQASLFGKQTLWTCGYCGAVICTMSGRGKPHGTCPSCDSHEWHPEEVPVAMFKEIEN